MAKKRFYSGDYAGRSSSDAQQRSDSMMISEDRSAMANLPQSAIMKPWPSSGSYATSDYDDTIRGVNAQIGADDAGAKRRKGGFKY